MLSFFKNASTNKKIYSGEVISDDFDKIKNAIAYKLKKELPSNSKVKIEKQILDLRNAWGDLSFFKKSIRNTLKIIEPNLKRCTETKTFRGFSVKTLRTNKDYTKTDFVDLMVEYKKGHQSITRFWKNGFSIYAFGSQGVLKE